MREAIEAANRHPGRDIIEFGPQLTSDGAASILLGGNELRITDSLTLSGPGADLLTISGGGQSRVFNIDDGRDRIIDVEITGVTVTGGTASVPTAGGAGIRSTENLTLRSFDVSGNDAGTSSMGGGIQHSMGQLTLLDGLLSNNQGSHGGGIHFESGVGLIVNTTIAENNAVSGGGGVYQMGGTLRFHNATVAQNRLMTPAETSNSGAGIEALTRTVELQNSIVAGNLIVPESRSADVGGTLSPLSSFNLIGDADSAGGLVHELGGNILGDDGTGVLPFLSILTPGPGLHGGPTGTYRLPVNSPAIDAGNNLRIAEIPGGPSAAADQRGSGFPRIIDGNLDGQPVVDIGAFESPPIPVILGPTGRIPELRPLIEWVAIPDVRNYRITMQRIGEATSLVDLVTRGTDLRVPFVPGIGRYRIWLRGQMNSGELTPWVARDFEISTPVVIEEIPLHAETLLPTFSWNAVPGADFYRVYISNVTTRQSGVVDLLVGGTTYTPSEPFSFGRYRTWVQPVGPSNYRAAWSGAREFYVGPQLLSPLLPMTASPAEFQWTDLPGVESYHLYVQSGRNAVINFAGIRGTSYLPESPLPGGEYRWWILPSTAAGQQGLWSPVGQFNTSGRTQIAQPQDTQTTGLVRFDWLPVVGAETYEIFIFNETTRSLAIRTCDISDTTYTSTPLPDADYRVWVRTRDPQMNPVAWSRPVRFTVATTSPGGPTSTVTSSQFPTFNTSPTISWTASSGASTAELVFYNEAEVIHVRDVTGSAWTPDAPMSPVPWKWLVRSGNGDGQFGPWSLPGQLDLSGRPVLFAPQGPVPNPRPEIQWTAVGQATRYVFQLDNLTTGENAIIRINDVAESFFRPDRNLPSGRYRAWVLAIGPDGPSPWSVALIFNVID